MVEKGGGGVRTFFGSLRSLLEKLSSTSRGRPAVFTSPFKEVGVIDAMLLPRLDNAPPMVTLQAETHAEELVHAAVPARAADANSDAFRSRPTPRPGVPTPVQLLAGLLTRPDADGSCACDQKKRTLTGEFAKLRLRGHDILI